MEWGPDLPTPEPEEVAAAARSTGISEEEARLRLALGPAVDRLHERLRAEHGALLSGLWWDTEGPLRLVIGVTGDAERVLAEARADFPRPALLEVVVQEHDLRELEALQDQVFDRRDQFREAGMEPVGAFVDAEANMLVVEVEDIASADLAAARQIMGTQAVRIEQGPALRAD